VTGRLGLVGDYERELFELTDTPASWHIRATAPATVAAERRKASHEISRGHALRAPFRQWPERPDLGTMPVTARSAPCERVRGEEIDGFLGEMADEHAGFAHMSQIVKSVIDCGKTAELAGTTSMHDLIVVPTPYKTRRSAT
jgi:hypothetical protein